MTRLAVRIILALVLCFMAETAFTAEQYIYDITHDKITVCKFVKLTVERHLSDLKRVGKPDFPYYFDAGKAKRKIAFSQELRHTKGEWARRKQKLKLEPWQQFIDWVVYGWRCNDTGLRRFSKVYIEVARKNGKTTSAATNANYAFMADGEEGPEVYCVATKKDQAKIAWEEAERQLQKQPVLKSRVKTYKNNSTVTIPGTAAKMTILGKDSEKDDGLNPSFGLIDEYHAHPTNEMVDILDSGMGSREQPIIWIITTSGFDKNKPCYQEERTLIVDILEKNIDPVPENIFGIIFTLDKGDDWTDPNVWIKANPNLGVSVKHGYLEKRVQEAILSPAKQNNVKTKNFNIWTQAESRWLTSEAWEGCNGVIDERILLGKTCYGALDLSTNIDITSWTLCFPPNKPKEKYIFLFRFFIPDDNIIEKQKKDKVPYVYWKEKGFVYATPGNVIDYDFIETTILKDSSNFNISEIAYDPWNSTEIINHLMDNSLELIPFRQGFGSMSAPSKDFEKKVLSKELNAGGNPVMTWMVSCTEVNTDPAGNIKPVKPNRYKSGKRIDGVVTAIMSLDRAVNRAGIQEAGCMLA